MTMPPAPTPEVGSSLSRRVRRTIGVSVRSVMFLVISIIAGGLAAAMLVPFVASAGAGAKAVVGDFESLPDEISAPALPEQSVILAADGTKLATVFTQNRLVVPLTSVAPVMRQAIVAIEDSRFYEHKGLDLKGTVRAVVQNRGDGGQVQGGSTLTQQYVKQILVNSASDVDGAQAAKARTLSRKVQELRYAQYMEQTLSKDQILEGYLNIAYFGSGAYGVEAAARRYFSVSAKDLTLPQAATLAGLVQSPVRWDPLRNPRNSQLRRSMVLNRMVSVGDITRAQADPAIAIPTKKLLAPTTFSNGCTTSLAPYFCDYILKTIANEPAFGATPEARTALLQRGGLIIKTTLDLKIQKAAQSAVEKYIPIRDKSRKAAAITMVRPGSGEIVAMAQNRVWGTTGARGATALNYNVGTRDGGVNGAPAGSTFKVFTMAAALEKGVDPLEKIEAPQRATFEGFKNCRDGAVYPDYTVNNSTGAGSFNMFAGTAFSINTYFMELEARTGICEPVKVAERLGITTGSGDPIEDVPSFTLGTAPTTTLAVATAYASLANHGQYCPSTAITSITDRDGKKLTLPTTACKQAITRNVADTVTEILTGVMDGPLQGRTGALMSLDRPAAGKTGTINDSAAVWFAGYTPDLAAAVWVGDPRGGQRYPMKNIVVGGEYFQQVFGSSLPGPIWKAAMLGALKDSEPKEFNLRTLGGVTIADSIPKVYAQPCLDGQTPADDPGPYGVPCFIPSTPTDSPSPDPSNPDPSATPSDSGTGGNGGGNGGGGTKSPTPTSTPTSTPTPTPTPTKTKEPQPTPTST